MFAGFPPRDKKSLEKWLDGLKHVDGTIIFYESPHRVAKTLPVIRQVLGDRRMAMIRELTKRHEEAVRGTVSECEEWLREHEAVGEYCLVLADDEQKLSREAEENGWWRS